MKTALNRICLALVWVVGTVAAAQAQNPVERIVKDDFRAGTSRTQSYITNGAADAGACTTIGEQKIAIILVSFPSKPLLGTITADMLSKIYFGPAPSVDSFLRESSYGKTWATGQVLGSVVLDADYFDQPTAVRDAAIRAASSLADFTKYTRIVLVVPQSSTGLESGGLGSIGCSTVPLYAQGSITASTTWLGDVSMGSFIDAVGTAAHEMGHNFGLQHARAADFGDEPLGPVGQLPAPFDAIHDYGDSFSTMGRNQGHWAAPQKTFLGWLNDGADVSTVETAGSFVLQPYENSSSASKAIRVRRGTGNNAWLWIEYRQAIGIDGNLYLPGAFTGAMIHYEDAGWQDPDVHSNLVRFNADTPSGTFFDQAPLTAGASWSDPYTNLTIKVGQATAAGLPVTVSYAPPSGCPVSLSPANRNFSSSAGTGSIVVAAPAGCSWAASSSVPWIAIGSGASGTGNGSVNFTVSASSVTASRWGRIAVGSLVAVVSQDGLAGSAAISPTSASFPAAGGVGSLNVSTNASDYPWSFESNAAWITDVFASKVMTIGSATMRYVVSQNTGSTPRTGTITIADNTYTVIQAAAGYIGSELAWQEQPSPDAPISRLCMDMAPLTSRGEVVLYGGVFDTTPFTDTWVWDGSAWSQRYPAHNPGPRCGHTMAYDPVRHQVVLFGGSSPTSSGSNDTWIWDGTDWTQLHPPSSPPARSNHAMVTNPVTGTILLFGGAGLTNGGKLSDTWEWNGSTWTQRFSSAVPPPRYGHAMAYDAARNQIVLFGGTENEDINVSPMTYYSDTWVWDGNQWTQKAPAVSPSPRYGHKMQYDPDLQQVVLVGGEGATNVPLSPPFTYDIDMREETWTWDGAAWLERFPDKSPEFSYSYGMVYDVAHGAFIVHLGDDLHCATRGPKTYYLKVGPTSFAFSIAGSGGASLVSSGTASAVTSGYASIQPDNGSSTPAGLAIFGFHQNGILVSEAGVPASPLIQSARIYAEVNGPVNTGLAIANPNGQAAAISFYFTDLNGTNFGSGTATIPANGKIAAFLNEAPFNGGASLSGSFTFTSPVPVSAVALRGLTNERSEFLITTLPVTDLNAPATTGAVTVPDYADGGGWSTQIVLVNSGDSTLAGSIQFRNPSGAATGSSLAYSIPPRTSQRFQTAGTAVTTGSGSVIVVPGSNNAPAPSGLAILSFRSNGITVAQTGVPVQPAGTAFDFYAEASGVIGQVGSIQTGIAVVNNSRSTATITLELNKLDGSPAGLAGTLTVGANGQVSTFLNQIPGFASLPAPFQGVLRVSSTASISVMGLRARYNERADFLFTTTPGVNEAAASSATPLYFPHIVDSGGYTTQFILFSTQPGQSPSGSIQLYSSTGGALNWTIQ